MNRILELAVLFIFIFGAFASAQDAYRVPPPRIAEILEKPPTPIISVNPRGESIILMELLHLPDIKLLAQPMLRLAGLRIWPALSMQQKFIFVKRYVVREIAGGKETVLQIPSGTKGGRAFWSYDGKKIALPVFSDNGMAIWVFNPETGTGKQLTDYNVNSILLPWGVWTRDNKSLRVPLIPANRGNPPSTSPIPAGPIVEETAGKVSKLRTFQDLLKTAADDDLFEYYANSQIVQIDTETGEKKMLGEPGLYTRISTSPDGKYFLTDRLKKPFSHILPVDYFAHEIEVRDSGFSRISTIADLPAAEDLPIQGVTKGPRSVGWQPLRSSTLVWTEALDDGDPNNKVPFREQIRSLSEPFSGQPGDLFKIPERFSGIDWLQEPGLALISDYDRDRKWTTTRLFDLKKTMTASDAKLIFDRSENDDYNDPGSAVHEVSPDGQSYAIYEKGWMFFEGQGATPNGDRPFLRKFRISDGASTTVFLCASGTYESFEDFAEKSRRSIITSFETSVQVPNFHLRRISKNRAGKGKPLTAFPDPAPELTRIRKEALKYKRDDGIPLSGMLYYPAGYVPGKKYPVVVWAYPLEYADPKMAGQVRVTDTRFPRLEYSSVLFFLLHDYAVLYNAEIPVVGDPKTVNDTYIEQISAGAKAAVEALVSKGITDSGHIGVTGHSYGANMVAHLLAHTDYFAAGIARSGAYNRTLTPFGFQGERRTFWEVPEIYLKLSPFTHASKINEPLLLIHGELDENSGTFPMQSERLIAAIRGAGGKCRLVKLPYEGHGYRARESCLHVLAEMFDWFDTYVRKDLK